MLTDPNAPASAAESAGSQLAPCGELPATQPGATATAQACSHSPAELPTFKIDRGVPTRDTQRMIMSSAAREPGNSVDRYIVVMHDSAGVQFDQRIDFQSQLEPVGINGVTVENLLEICADRLRSFQAGPFACEANEIAISHIQFALASLYERTAERKARGAEGKHTA